MSKTIPLPDGGKIYLQAKGIKTTTRGKVLSAAEALGSLSKGARRAARKALNRNGRRDLVLETLGRG